MFEYKMDVIKEKSDMGPSLLQLLEQHLAKITGEGWEPSTITYCNTDSQTYYHYFLVVRRREVIDTRKYPL